jgi:hypothetical protein
MARADSVRRDARATVARLRALAAQVAAEDTPRRRLETFVRGMLALQRDDPGLNDAILRRRPNAVALVGVCERSTALGRDLVRAAHADGSLGTDFTGDDLARLLWLTGIASRDPHAPAGWPRLIERALAAAWTAPTP